ncbi:MAG: hypothetical protein HY074_15600 [Deltaproteobacteria bacterium]|nr:hypothetical protein [Deltaproteobacteria bacterium]
MDIGKLIGKLITVALVLATAGTLYEVTIALKEAALDTQRHGMVSLGAFNRRLERGR